MHVGLPPELLAGLERGATAITGNERAARALRQAWDEVQRVRGLERWEPASALSWRSWTHILWQSLLLRGKASALLMNPLQEQQLWTEVLRADPPLATLREPEALAALAGEAWGRLWAYQGEHRLGISGAHGDAASFARWADRFAERCRREDLLSEAELESELAAAVRAGAFQATEEEIFLFGFDQKTPAQEALLTAWREAGRRVQEIAPASPARAACVAAAADEEEELRGCARWLRQFRSERPEASVAVIVADVAGERDALDSVLRQILSPGLQDIRRSGAETPWEFSLGRPLDCQPMIQVALDLLRWGTEPLSLDRVSRLLLSRYFGAPGSEESQLRAQLDAALRKESRLRPEISLAGLRQYAGQCASGRPLVPLLSGLLEASRALSGDSRGFTNWAEETRKYLQAAAWVGTTSVDFQLRERWESVLDTLSTLDFSGRAASFAEVLHLLERLTRDTVFAAESNQAPIQIMGLKEAAGSRFDAIWVLRTGEAGWPPQARAHPLLPWGLQRELQMPGTSRDVDRSALQMQTERLLASADEVIFSYALTNAQAAHQRAAGIIRALDLPSVTIEDFAPADAEMPPISLESYEDATRLSPLRNPVVRGGANVLKLQAACGFRAFAEIRLGSAGPAQRDLGMNPGERGVVVHSALEQFWKSVKTQKRLKELTPQERASEIAQAAEHSLRHEQRRSETRWDGAYLRVQQQRLERLLLQWLETEAERPEFEVIHQESHREVEVGPLRLSLRLDRVDRVNGKQVVLDYKTGSVKPSSWLGERPDEPQIPLYALLAGEDAGVNGPIGALGLGTVRVGKEMGLRGFEAEEGVMLASGKKPAPMEGESLADQVELWRERLYALAFAFAEGDAGVRPKSYPVTCERCEQRLLCRVDASLLDAAFEDSANEGEGEHG